MISCDDAPRIVIIGAGIAGLSLAYHLNHPYFLYEKEQVVGGLCRSEVIAGCTFDYAPKVLLLGDAYATDLSCQLLGDNVEFTPFSDWSYHHRYGAYTRTPFQKHLYGLPKTTIMRALAGLLISKLPFRHKHVQSYRDWLYQQVGRPIADMVIIPQEHKKWKVDPAEMDYRWAPSRVARPNFKTTLHGALRDVPQSRHLGYPRRGGIAALMEAFALHLHHVHLGVSLRAVDTRKHIAYFNNGSIQPYRALVSSLPLPLLIAQLDSVPADIRAAAARLTHLSLQCVCLVVQRAMVSDKHFVYIHDPEFIFHRLSFLSNLSPAMAPVGYSTILAEVSYVDQPPLNDEALIQTVQNDLIRMHVLHPNDNIVASRVLSIPYAYPRQTVDRLENVRRIRAYLETLDIYSFGRFGEWEYYNMHHIIPRARDLAAQLDRQYVSIDGFEPQHSGDSTRQNS